LDYADLSRYQLSEADATLAGKKQIVVVTTIGFGMTTCEWRVEDEGRGCYSDTECDKPSGKLCVVRKAGVAKELGLRRSTHFRGCHFGRGGNFSLPELPGSARWSNADGAVGQSGWEHMDELVVGIAG
jgi:hypothetical protein